MKVKMNIDTTITNFPITKVWKKGKKAIKEGKGMKLEISSIWE